MKRTVQVRILGDNPEDLDLVRWKLIESFQPDLTISRVVKNLKEPNGYRQYFDVFVEATSKE